MCRIAGLIAEGLNQSQIRASVTAMCNTMQHGGPDDEGIYEDESAGLAFGHRRLSIIDLSKNGHQPMTDPRNRVWITFNGEIYNYRELRANLERSGVTFNTQTDTEVLIQVYCKWGTSGFNKLRGIFAFALYDSARFETYLVRDSSGVKPLYYSSNRQRLAFASEIKAFKAAGIATQPNTVWPVLLLAYGHIPEPQTTLKDVYSLPKGHYLCRNKNGSVKLEKYTCEVIGDQILTINGAEDGIRHLLNASVKRQMLSDAPIGVFLSGGIDSSILSLLANEEGGEQLKTISIFFNEKQYNERQYQNAVLKKIAGNTNTHLVTERDFSKHFPDILAAMDMPTTDGINSWFISKYAHDTGLKAVLSGIGADELFGGYPSFKRIRFIKQLRRFPASLLLKTSRLSIGNFKRLSYLAYDHSAADYLFLRGLYTVSDIALILNIHEAEVSQILFDQNTHSRSGNYDKLHAAWYETNIYMQNQLLRDTDVMSMCHGLEVRVPFLDEDLQAFTSHIDPAIRFEKGRPKQLLIDSFKDILPQAVWNRPKMGFTFPLQQWMKNNPDVVNTGRYKGSFAKKTIEGFKSGTTHWSQAFALYQVQAHV
ncbi:asparagine synthase (glutamine-hydrolyzing) [Mucilaginibacter terrenus]|uniref:asparagine synthase (glutamine-hydrolyzing) n=1 Tax=Mucilaginibacter terrenus TaxID=2482727 RepID=A0A3E2NMJ9_9SPHI|nr:asparagine synthase (glutamine-hydrolyzing) [Mucilaginibacter terrenus]RFZ82227.1 asparagine synthase (glutamine-hydrolyzing) [Mucilaginibacter terrenus]